MTTDQVNAERERRKLQSLNNRRQHVDGCYTCEYFKKLGKPSPWHDASERCRSGYEEHCSCEACD